MTPALLQELLAPISPEAPAGIEIIHAQPYDEIKKLRKGEDGSLPQGSWSRELLTAQWPKVRELCEDILRTQSKDLQVAGWYTEALTRLEGFPGFTFGLKVLQGLMERYWEQLHPLWDPADPEERLARFEWLNSQLPTAINQVPVTSPDSGGHTRLKWDESRMVENLGARDPAAREQALAEGKLSAEAFDKAVIASGQGFHLALHEQVALATNTLEGLERTLDRHFGVDAPSLEDIRDTLSSCSNLIKHSMSLFGLSPTNRSTPPPRMPAPAPRQPMNETSTTPTTPVPEPPQSSDAIRSRTDAIRRLREIAIYFRTHEPHSPVGPLAERAARWGEMPLDEWLTRVIRDETTLSHLRELLDLRPETSQRNS